MEGTTRLESRLLSVETGAPACGGSCPEGMSGIMIEQVEVCGSGHASEDAHWLVGLSTIFSNISENIDGPAHFRIREYSREYRCPGAAFSQESTRFLQPLTLVDLESQEILEYSRRYIAAPRTVLTTASRGSSFAPSTVGFGSMQTEIFKFWTFLSGWEHKPIL